MNKAVIILIIGIIIVGIIALSMNSETDIQNSLPFDKTPALEKIEEEVESEGTGRNLSVEVSESLGLSSP